MVVLIGLPLILPYVLLSGKRRRSLLYKLGLKSMPGLIENQDRDSQPRIWIHALSVGEVISSIPLVKALNDRQPGDIIYSASTLTGYDTACKRLQDQVTAVIFSPYDLRYAVNRTLDRMSPSLALIVETDVWPNMIDSLQQRRIPVLLVNARLSDRSLRGYRRLKHFAAALFPRFTKICTQTHEDAGRFMQLGVSEDQLVITGNLKFDQTYDPVSNEEKVQLRKRLGIAPDAKIVVAGSTHEGEESVLAEAFKRVRMSHPTLVLIDAPRNPYRSAAIADLFDAAGLKPCLLSDIDASGPDRSADVVIIDTIGLLVKLYALCDIAIVGGSLLDIRGIGGHNPLEPAAYAKPIIFGKNMRNFRQIAGMLETAGGALTVEGSDQLASALRSLLENTRRSHEIGEQAHKVFNANKGAVAKTIDLALEHLKRVPNHYRMSMR